MHNILRTAKIIDGHGSQIIAVGNGVYINWQQRQFIVRTTDCYCGQV